jgi:hypothetical protein
VNVRAEWILTGKEPRERGAPVATETIVVPNDEISEQIFLIQAKERAGGDLARIQAAEALSERYRNGKGFSSADEVLNVFERLVKAARKIVQRVNDEDFAADAEKKTTPKIPKKK